jgi:hypothetical protein
MRHVGSPNLEKGILFRLGNVVCAVMLNSNHADYTFRSVIPVPRNSKLATPNRKLNRPHYRQTAYTLSLYFNHQINLWLHFSCSHLYRCSYLLELRLQKWSTLLSTPQSR